MTGRGGSSLPTQRRSSPRRLRLEYPSLALPQAVGGVAIWPDISHQRDGKTSINYQVGACHIGGRVRHEIKRGHPDFLGAAEATNGHAGARLRLGFFVVFVREARMDQTRRKGIHPNTEGGGLQASYRDGQDRPGKFECASSNVRVPVSNIVLGEGRGFEVAQSRLGPGRIHHCMRLIGCAERALELMCKRANRRVAFGHKLGEHGSVREDIAHSWCEIEQARLLTLRAADKMDRDGNKAARDLIASAKIVVPTMAARVIDRAIQIHGGAGVSQDTFLAEAYTYARFMRIGDGPEQVHVAIGASVAETLRRKTRSRHFATTMTHLSPSTQAKVRSTIHRLGRTSTGDAFELIRGCVNRLSAETAFPVGRRSPSIAFDIHLEDRCVTDEPVDGRSDAVVGQEPVAEVCVNEMPRRKHAFQKWQAGSEVHVEHARACMIQARVSASCHSTKEMHRTGQPDRPSQDRKVERWSAAFIRRRSINRCA